MADGRQELGRRAEDAVASWLAERGWLVLERRWRLAGRGEIDLICRDPHGALVGVEVKLRSSGRAGTGQESVDEHRLARLRRTLAAYAALAAEAGQGPSVLRLDVVALAPNGDGRWQLSHLHGVAGW